ncbi:hypothetical protein QVD17_17813 [Tagetes erecta]|uniref:Uncharacterized protein n=1 Tax=Tagetes erecta TaxID=13708 RepID=A0AAD8P1U0_TARER|nr:hypothetical protein QVD17_17813 [Tagetes erecta]
MLQHILDDFEFYLEDDNVEIEPVVPETPRQDPIVQETTPIRHANRATKQVWTPTKEETVLSEAWYHVYEDGNMGDQKCPKRFWLEVINTSRLEFYHNTLVQFLG